MSNAINESDLMEARIKRFYIRERECFVDVYFLDKLENRWDLGIDVTYQGKVRQFFQPFNSEGDRANYFQDIDLNHAQKLLSIYYD